MTTNPFAYVELADYLFANAPLGAYGLIITSSIILGGG